MISPHLPSGRKVLLVDLFVILYALAFVALGRGVADALDELRVLSDAVEATGGAINESGAAIGTLNQVPLVGSEIGQAAQGIQQTGGEIVTQGVESRGFIEDAADLVGLAIAVIPTVPLLAFYLPQRLPRTRESFALRRTITMSSEADPEGAERFLAERAAMTLPYRRLRKVSAEPWRDIAEGRYEALAKEELRRLGVRRGLLVKLRHEG